MPDNFIYILGQYFKIPYKLLIVMVILSLFSISGFAQITMMSDLERIGKADLIVIGTVDEVTDIGKATGQLKLRDIILLKGENPDKLVIVNLSSFRETRAKMLNLGIRYLFFLYRVQDGYTLYHGSLSLLPATDEQKIRDMIKEFPVLVTVAEPVLPINSADPFSDFMLTVTIANLSKEPKKISVIELEGYFEPKECPVADLAQVRDPERNGKHNDLRSITTIAPNDKYTVELRYPIEKPAEWLTNPPKEKKRYDLYMRVCVTVDANNVDKNTAEIFHACSSYCKTAVEYIP